MSTPHGARRPVSHAQRRIWLVQQFQPESVYYNLGFTMRLTGPLDVASLEEAFRYAVGRHDSLRTTFEDVDGEPYRVVADDWHAFHVEDTHEGNGSGMPAEARLDRWLSERYDLETGPLFRVGLLVLGPSSHVLGVYCHHIVADGHSMDTLIGDVFARYTAALSGGSADLAPPVGYDQYVAHETRRLSEHERTKLGDYWRRRLGGVPTDLGLSFESPGAVASAVVVPDAAVAALVRLGREERASLFMTCLSMYAVFVAALAGRDDVIIGTPVDLRSEEELEEVVGLCINTVPMRFHVGAATTFRDLLRSARSAQLDDLDHAEMPFDLIVDLLKPERTPGRHPLIQATFQLDPNAFVEMRHGDLHVARSSSETVVDPRFPPTARSRVGADFVIQAHLYAGGQLSGFLRLATGDAAIAHQFAEQFTDVIVELAAFPDKPLGEVHLEPIPRVHRAGPAQERVAGPAPAPADMVRQLAAVWTALLGQEAAAEDDFFQLGGNSLLANRLASRLRAEFRRAVTAVDVLREPVLHRQAAMLASRPPLGEASPRLAPITSHRMSAAQCAYWGIEAVTGDDLVMWMPTVIEIDGGEADRLADAIRAVVDRHPVLRSRVSVTVEDDSDDPVITLDDRGASLYQVAITEDGLDPMAVAERAMAVIPAVQPDDALAHFVIASTPGPVVLLMLVHAMVWDAGSRPIFLADLADAHASRRSGGAVGSYPHYAASESAWLAQKAQAERMDRLVTEMAKAVAHNGRTPFSDTDGDADGVDMTRIEIDIDLACAQRVQEVARRERTTTAVVLLSAWSRAFSALPGTGPVVVGTLASMREALVPADTIGPLTNTLGMVLPREVPPDPAMRIATIREAVVRALANVDLPFDAVSSRLTGAGVDPARLFAATFVMHDPWADSAAAGEVRFRVVRGASELATESTSEDGQVHVDVWAHDEGYHVVAVVPSALAASLQAAFAEDLP